LLLHLLRPQVHHAQDPLQFEYQEKVGGEDAVLYLLHRAYSHLDKESGAVRIMFFDFFQHLQHHPAPPTDRQADRDEGGLTPGEMDYRLPH